MHPLVQGLASASELASHSTCARICTSPDQSKGQLTSHTAQMWRAAHCQYVPAVVREIRRRGDT
jgi:hypothetical protein